MLYILPLLVGASTLAVAAPPRPHHARNRAAALSTMPPRSKTLSRARTSLRTWSEPRHLRASAWDPIYPADYGADPSGRADSSAGFDAAIAVLLTRGSGHTDESGTIDLGGAALDLQGGEYILSRSLYIPSNYSNFAIYHGTVRASQTFPADGFVIDIGTADSYCQNWGNSCTENVDMEDLMIDGSQIANGVRFNAVIGVNAGPDLFIINFTKVGVEMSGGHEVELHESWVGSCWYTPPDACWLNATALGNTTGIAINGNDHLLNQVVVFAGKTGVSVNGAANILTAVHTWNTQVASVPDAIGIIVSQWQNRLVAPYLDFVPLILKGSAVTTVTNGFFLCSPGVVFVPDPNSYPVQGVLIANNEFVCGGDVVASGAPADYSGLQDVTVSGNVYDNDSIHKSTVATLTIFNASSPWVFDFAPHLVFAPSANSTRIRTVSFYVVAPQGTPFFQSYALPPVAGEVTVVADRAVVATVTCVVDQSDRTTTW